MLPKKLRKKRIFREGNKSEANPPIYDIGNGLRFDGVNDFVSIPCPLNSPLDFDFSDDFSFSVWINQKTNATQSNSDKGINRISTGDLKGYDIGFFTYNNNFLLFIALLNNSNNLISFVLFSEPLTNVANQNINYVFVKESSDANNFKIYKNGVPLTLEIIINNTPTGTMKSNKEIVINSQKGTNDFNKNDMHKLQAFSNALNQQEITELYNTKGNVIPDTTLLSLVANYTFNQKQGTVLIDEKNANNGTLINFADTSLGENNAWIDKNGNPITS